jgi:hypothetical protein
MLIPKSGISMPSCFMHFAPYVPNCWITEITTPSWSTFTFQIVNVRLFKLEIHSQINSMLLSYEKKTEPPDYFEVICCYLRWRVLRTTDYRNEDRNYLSVDTSASG